jgi:hypothetical protein
MRWHGSVAAVAAPLLLVLLLRSSPAILAVDVEHRALASSAASFGRPGVAQGTGECIGGLKAMCAAGARGEMNYPVGLSKKFLEEACYDGQCRMCTDVAWACELVFKSGSYFEQYNAVSERVARAALLLFVVVVGVVGRRADYVCCCRPACLCHLHAIAEPGLQ